MYFKNKKKLEEKIVLDLLVELFYEGENFKYDFGTVNAVCICADDGKCGNV